MLEKNKEKIDWYKLSRNEGAIDILERNLEKVHWWALSSNTEASSILEKNMDKINWYVFIEWNSDMMFVDEYEEKSREYFRKYVTEELMAKMFHPRNLRKFSSWGYEEFDDMEFEE